MSGAVSGATARPSSVPRAAKAGQLYLKELWRYPVKSLGGEPLSEADVREDGIAGDRVVQVVNELGATVTARTHGGLLSLRAALGEDGEPRVDGLSWRHPDIAARTRRVAGPDAELVRFDGVQRFDILPLLVATDGAVRAFGEDGRRLRPNLVIENVDGLAERTWEGMGLRVGEALIGIHSLRDRCIVTTYDPDTVEQRVDVLRDIYRRFDGKLALNCWVIRGGRIRVGDPVELVPDLPVDVPRAVLGRMAR